MCLKQDIESKLGIPVNLKAGMPGSLDIFVDGERIYSKAQTGAMPQYTDLATLIEKRRTPARATS